MRATRHLISTCQIKRAVHHPLQPTCVVCKHSKRPGGDCENYSSTSIEMTKKKDKLRSDYPFCLRLDCSDGELEHKVIRCCVISYEVDLLELSTESGLCFSSLNFLCCRGAPHHGAVPRNFSLSPPNFNSQPMAKI